MAAFAPGLLLPEVSRLPGITEGHVYAHQGAIADLRAVLQLSPDDAGAADAVHEAWLRQRH